MPDRRPRQFLSGFTLVELLVVIGIIALLISMLLPALARAKENANRVACASNLRQLGTAFVMYTSENRGWFPFHASIGEVDPVSGAPYRYEDWIWWQKGRAVEDSRIAAHLDGFQVKVLRCPSDNVQYHTRFIYPDPYAYSYTMNMLLSSDPTMGSPNVKITAIHRAADKLMLVEEDERSLDDGNFHPRLVGTSVENYLATRHDGHRTDLRARGNACLADGHVDYVDRAFTQDAYHFDPLKD